MKKEDIIVDRLEKVSDSLNDLMAAQDDDASEDAISPDAKLQAMFLVGSLFALGWVLDCEDELRKVVVQLGMQEALEQASYLLAEKGESGPS